MGTLTDSDNCLPLPLVSFHWKQLKIFNNIDNLESIEKSIEIYERILLLNVKKGFSPQVDDGYLIMPSLFNKLFYFNMSKILGIVIDATNELDDFLSEFSVLYIKNFIFEIIPYLNVIEKLLQNNLKLSCGKKFWIALMEHRKPLIPAFTKSYCFKVAYCCRNEDYINSTNDDCYERQESIKYAKNVKIEKIDKNFDYAQCSEYGKHSQRGENRSLSNILETQINNATLIKNKLVSSMERKKITTNFKSIPLSAMSPILTIGKLNRSIKKAPLSSSYRKMMESSVNVSITEELHIKSASYNLVNEYNSFFNKSIHSNSNDTDNYDFISHFVNNNSKICTDVYVSKMSYVLVVDYFDFAVFSSMSNSNWSTHSIVWAFNYAIKKTQRRKKI
ncbi:hypothetical protein A3Q56_07810 [Intoshia linei]|uniref:Uncharacterized protein n=1 Tax=Intoshia linei TaxID=1819745 RepID=A0A177ASW5_9BILA|nr:hypothetical protein A3Q56_07810 [Intoshia linei]